VVDCNDDNVCTDDSCNSMTGCVNTNNTASCDDEDACVGGAPPDCDDNNVCTADSCDAATGCVNDGTGITVSCNDDDACTENDVCQGDAAGTCAGGAVDCNDSNICTADSCDAVIGCINDGTGVTVSCDDGDACTQNDVCQGDAVGTCGGGAVDCNDDNVCTDDSCDAATGCINTNNTLPCDDGDECTTADTCSGGACVGGAPTDCDDGVSCTDDSCNSVTGCVNAPNDANCPDDNLFCNGTEFCDASLDCSSTGDPCPGGTVCNETIDICEGAAQPLLTVNKLGQGDGTVTSDPAGIDCGMDCDGNFDLDSEVGLTAARGSNSTFEGWGGDCSGTTLGTTVTMSTDKTCTATFEACVSVKDVSGETISDEQYFEACTTLLAGTFQVRGPGGTVTLLAGLEVVLGESFEVLAGGTLVIGNDASLLP
jgi:hypothetical protein